MKRHLLTIATLLACCLLTTINADAQSRRGNGNTRPGHGSTIRPGNNKPGNNRPDHGNRPGFGNDKGDDKHHRPQPGTKPERPGGQRPGQGFRPGSGNNGGDRHHRPQPGHGFKPQPSHNGHMRPGRPGPTHRPGLGYRPGLSYRPGPNRPPMIHPPMRPGRPPMLPWTRPVPPRGWRPVYTGSLLGNILGLSFGVAIGTALDNLYYSGYNIDGYVGNEVYLTGVNQFNYYWPDATLYFTNGALTRSQFFNPTMGYDVTRYYDLYANLCAAYGNPVTQNMAGTTLSATWFGGYNDYITLQYTPLASGNYNYFTILTIGR